MCTLSLATFVISLILLLVERKDKCENRVSLLISLVEGSKKSLTLLYFPFLPTTNIRNQQRHFYIHLIHCNIQQQQQISVRDSLALHKYPFIIIQIRVGMGSGSSKI
jgi:hypothetical protein